MRISAILTEKDDKHGKSEMSTAPITQHSKRKQTLLVCPLLIFLLLGLNASGAFAAGFFGWGNDSYRQVFDDAEVSETSETFEIGGMEQRPEENNPHRGLFASKFQQPFVIRAQQQDYWGTVQQQYSPTFVAQSTDAASVAPSLGAPTTSSAPSSTSSIAPPLTDVNTSILEPCPAPPAAEGDTFLTEPVGTMKRFWDSFSLNYTYIPRSGKEDGLGVNEFDLAGRFALPCKFIPHAGDNSVSGYWFIAPSFGLTLWSGPLGPPTNRMSMPSKTFEAALAAGARPQFTKDFGMDVWVQVGLASAFSKVTSKAIFIRGRALGTLRINEQIDAVGGVVYYDRNRYKLLPSGGVTWKPNDGNLWYLVFPNPKLSRFLSKVNETDWWGYIQGDIGGGRWLVNEEYGSVNVDYNDYRVGVGVTFSTPSSIAGSLEIGGAFGRELYAFGGAWYKPKSMIYLKGGIMY